MPSIDSIISFLVSRKFGSTAILAPALANFGKSQNSENSKIVAKIEEYKCTLREAQTNDLLTFYNSELVKQENERFYNQPYANADFVHWAKAAQWSVDEAIALSFGKEPEKVTWKKIEPLKNETVFAKQFAKRRDLALRAVQARRMGDYISPVEFITWALEINIDIPKLLIDEVTKLSGVIINWHEQYLKVKAERDDLAKRIDDKQKPESTRKIDNLLQAITAIAIDSYRYNPKIEKSNVPQQMSDDISKSGKAIDTKTIRGWLKEGLALLPPKPHKD